ncbi:MAG: type II toxin-antitoxin system HigB family toxin [Candidatus Sulfotelmatobacter sp.]
MLGTEVLEKAKRLHRDLAAPVATWLAVAREARWRSLNELRHTWRNTDRVKARTVFNIKGNKYRLIAIVNYESQTILLKSLLTHAEYDKEDWNK